MERNNELIKGLSIIILVRINTSIYIKGIFNK